MFLHNQKIQTYRKTILDIVWWRHLFDIPQRKKEVTSDIYASTYL